MWRRGAAVYLDADGKLTHGGDNHVGKRRHKQPARRRMLGARGFHGCRRQRQDQRLSSAAGVLQGVRRF